MRKAGPVSDDPSRYSAGLYGPEGRRREATTQLNPAPSFFAQYPAEGGPSLKTHLRWARVLILAGLVIMILGAVDPLEGSLLVVPGVGLAALGAALGRTRKRREVYGAFALVVIGVGALWGLSVAGGVGGDTGRPMAWLLVALPYPLGWVLGVVGAARAITDLFHTPVPKTTH